MYALTVRDHIMIAHSFHGEIFGPAQRVHGATYLIDACFQRSELDADGLVVDIGLASDTLRTVLADLNFRNLDDEPAFKGKNTTTEYLCLHIHGLLAAACQDGRMGPGGAGVSGIKVLLRESHVAWAAFEGPVG